MLKPAEKTSTSCWCVSNRVSQTNHSSKLFISQTHHFGIVLDQLNRFPTSTSNSWLEEPPAFSTVIINSAWTKWILKLWNSSKWVRQGKSGGENYQVWCWGPVIGFFDWLQQSQSFLETNINLPIFARCKPRRGNIFGCDSSPRSPNVSMSVCLCVTLATTVLKIWTLKFLDWRNSEGLLKEFWRTYKSQPPGLWDLYSHNLIIYHAMGQCSMNMN